MKKEEQVVSLKVARLLAVHGFCMGSTYYYNNLDSTHKLCRNNNGEVYLNRLEVDFIEAPTQSLAQRWLRDEKGVVVLVTMDDVGMSYTITSNTIDYKEIRHYLSYESALENGLNMALDLL